jgi:YD repeat-containing protein
MFPVVLTDGATTTYSYNADEELTQAVTGSSTTTYGDDADGDQTTAGDDTFTYNGAGKMSEAVRPAGTSPTAMTPAAT